MAHELLLYGLVLIGGIIFGIRYLYKLWCLAAAAQKIKDEEEIGAKKANGALLSSSFNPDIGDLRKELEGYIILPSDGEKYQSCRRRPFNHNQRGFPCVIVRVQNTKDVVRCIKFVNNHRKDINLCVASGCHSSKAMMDDAFVIDLCNMNKVDLDKANMTVKVDGGAYLGEIDKVLQPHNFGVPVGSYPQTGVGGLVLGGGFGFLARMHGFSVDNLLECEVVLHSGEVVVTNDTQNPDLIWGLRGGSGNFGIVTKFTFRVHQLPPSCLCGSIVQLTPTLSSAVNVATNFDSLVSDLPNHMSADLIFPAGAPVTPSLWAHFGEERTADEVPCLQQAKKLGGWATVQSQVKARSYHRDLQTITTPVVTSGHLYHSLIQFGEQGEKMPIEFWEKVLVFTRAKLHPVLKSAVLVSFAMGGKMAANDREGTRTCLTQATRNARYFGIIEVYWKPEFGEEGKNAARDWARTVSGIIKPYSNDSLRYATMDSTIEDNADNDIGGYGMERYPKLRALKKEYDPTNLFKNNANIEPAK